MISCGKLEANR